MKIDRKPHCYLLRSYYAPTDSYNDLGIDYVYKTREQALQVLEAYKGPEIISILKSYYPVDTVHAK